MVIEPSVLAMIMPWILLVLMFAWAETQAQTGNCNGGEMLGDSGECKDGGLRLHPSRSFGGGCVPFLKTGGEVAWSELLNTKALSKKAAVFVCRDLRGSSSAFHKDSRLKSKPAAGGIILVENFLSAREVKHMRKIAEAWISDSEDQGGWRFAYGMGSQFRENADIESARQLHAATYAAFEDPILNRVEERIAKLLKIPASMFENYLQLMEETGSRTSALHHDKNHALLRRATALLYLAGNSSTVYEGLVGGETLFPALPRMTEATGGIGKSKARQRELKMQLEDIVYRTIAALGSEDAWPELQLVSGAQLHTEVMELCARAGSQAAFEGEKGYGPLLAIAPVQGRAVFWWHEGPVNRTQHGSGGEILADMWHVGCPVRSGKKLSLQKFKSHGPHDSACKGLRWCEESWRRMLGSNSEL